MQVYRAAMDAAMQIFEITKAFPTEEKYAMVNQIRRSSRSVCANLAEAWRRRRSAAHFRSKLNDAESEAEETRVWIEFAACCNSLKRKDARALYETYDKILGQLVNMIRNAEQWTIR